MLKITKKLESEVISTNEIFKEKFAFKRFQYDYR